MVDEVVDPVVGVERLEHVRAHEFGEVAHGLHRHRLPEQLHRLGVINTQSSAELLGIGRERVVDHRAGVAQAAAKFLHSGTEVAEVDRDRQIGICHHEHLLHCFAGFPVPEHLRDRHRVPERGVGEHGEQHTVGTLVAETHRLGGSQLIGPLGLEVTEYV